MTVFLHRGQTRKGPLHYSKFMAKWDTTQEGSANDTIVLPLVADGTYDFYIDWGDGNKDTITGYDQSEVTHQYSDTGIYTIQLVANDMVGWQFNDSGDDDKLVEIIEWGPLRFVSDDTNLFKGCSNLTLSTTSDPPFNADAAGMFQDCSSLTGTGGNILNWDMSSVTGMNFMLAGCTSLDPDLSNWDVSSIENAEGFMSGAGLSTMNYDRILSGWSLQSVQSGVNISFGDTKYSQESGEVFRDLLTSASTGWNIIDGGMIQMPAARFVTTWDTRRTSSKSTTNNRVMLPLLNDGQYDFEVDWGDGSTDHITNASSGARAHFYSTPGIYTISITGLISGWNVEADVRGPNGVYNNNNTNDSSTKLTCIHEWDALRMLHPNDRTPGVHDQQSYSYTFQQCDHLTGIPPTFIPSQNIDDSGFFKGMFSRCTGLSLQNFATHPITGWDMTKVKDIGALFAMCGWDQNNWSPLAFNPEIGTWDIGNVTNLSSTLSYAYNFNNGGSSSMSGWDTSSVTNMSFLFERVNYFPIDLSSWDTSNVTHMIGTFGSIGSWNPNVTNWDTSKVSSMYMMFIASNSFNQPIGNWDTSSLTNIGFMFQHARVFNQSLANWVVTGVTYAAAFLESANNFSTANYNATLIGWASQNVQNNVQMDFGSAKYSAGAAATARQTLVNKGWTIYDGGQA